MLWARLGMDKHSLSTWDWSRPSSLAAENVNQSWRKKVFAAPGAPDTSDSSVFSLSWSAVIGSICWQRQLPPSPLSFFVNCRWAAVGWSFSWKSKYYQKSGPKLPLPFSQYLKKKLKKKGSSWKQESTSQHLPGARLMCYFSAVWNYLVAFKMCCFSRSCWFFAC